MDGPFERTRSGARRRDRSRSDGGRRAAACFFNLSEIRPCALSGARFAREPDSERCLSGRKERFAKSSYGLNCTVGSNPTLSAKKVLIIPNVLSSGCSVARLSRLVWDQEVASSNLAIPTNPNESPSVYWRTFFIWYIGTY